MELHFLGTGAANPSPTRGASSVVLRNQSGSCWMFDCGEGTQIQLMKSNIRPGKLDKIFITHLHGDHLFGLPGLLCTISMNCGEGRDAIDIYGPEGLRQYLDTCLRLSGSQLQFSYTVHELCEKATESETGENKEPFELPRKHNTQSSNIYPNDNFTWDVLHEGNLRVSAAILKHRIICFGYVIQENDSLGKLDVASLKSIGIPPGPLYAKLKSGESIVTEDGRMVEAKDVLGPPCPGRKVVILGDTCDSGQISALAINADLLVHEATNENAHREKCIENGHSTSGMAGDFARSICAKRLVLTHFSQRYKGVNEELKTGEESVLKLLKETEEVFNDVVAAEDMLVINITRTKEPF